MPPVAEPIPMTLPPIGLYGGGYLRLRRVSQTPACARQGSLTALRNGAASRAPRRPGPLVWHGAASANSSPYFLWSSAFVPAASPY